ncbi:uncharacterized protein [Amphiura filiformis]|uniref:uncharacterized protein n=1 Tax=Amphiura filiformis TaxID=82378 RepID=UPI003B20DDF8
MYADDTQEYLTFRSDESHTSIADIERCISAIKSWMITNKLMLNDNKTEILPDLPPHFSIHDDIDSVTVCVGDVNVSASSTAQNLGVIIDDHMILSQHVSSICRSASFALYNIGKLRNYLNQASVTDFLITT